MFSRFRFLLAVSVALFATVVSACGGGSGETSAATPTPTPNPNMVRLAPSQDATLYEHDEGAIASSVGPTNFVGVTNRRERRRMLIAFDMTSLPANREITGVRLEMHMSKSASGAVDVTLHRVTSAWAEGTSAASGMGGKGTAALAGDPTWLHAAYPDTPWLTAGGDHVAAASAVTSVDNFVRYSWSGPGLAEDVRMWANGAVPNLGWLAIGDETRQKTAKRFDAREHASVDRRPSLVVELAPLP
jgi:hypothetical protein